MNVKQLECVLVQGGCEPAAVLSHHIYRVKLNDCTQNLIPNAKRTT